MKVELVQGTKDATKLLADIASICYGHEEAKNPAVLIRNLDILGHHSVFEHAFYTFKIEGISRACLAQLTRHRHASYTVRSQRYCDEGDTKEIKPDAIKEDEEFNMLWDENMHYTYSSYNRLIELGVKREDARAILPQASSTDLYMTLNLRELIHIAELRMSSSAQQEIRELVREMVRQVMKNDELLTNIFYKEVV